MRDRAETTRRAGSARRIECRGNEKLTRILRLRYLPKREIQYQSPAGIQGVRNVDSPEVLADEVPLETPELEDEDEEDSPRILSFQPF